VDKVLGRLRIRNFKAWRDTGQIELAPLTVLFGPNSSGKSSINHFLMMLKQTVRSPDRNSVFDFGDVDAVDGLRVPGLGDLHERILDFGSCGPQPRREPPRQRSRMSPSHAAAPGG
jgi:hypothetical protein